MSRMAVIFQNNRIHLMTIATSREYILEHYNVITFINKPLNPHNALMIKEYFDQHPEKILQYYLK